MFPRRWLRSLDLGADLGVIKSIVASGWKFLCFMGNSREVKSLCRVCITDENTKIVENFRCLDLFLKISYIITRLILEGCMTDIWSGVRIFFAVFESI